MAELWSCGRSPVVLWLHTRHRRSWSSSKLPPTAAFPSEIATVSHRSSTPSIHPALTRLPSTIYDRSCSVKQFR
ncbi:hypothetical protein TorRG33x02_162110, partial [Trema orientale]